MLWRGSSNTYHVHRIAKGKDPSVLQHVSPRTNFTCYRILCNAQKNLTVPSTICTWQNFTWSGQQYAWMKQLSPTSPMWQTTRLLSPNFKNAATIVKIMNCVGRIAPKAMQLLLQRCSTMLSMESVSRIISTTFSASRITVPRI